MIRKTLPLLAAVLFSCTFGSALAQTDTPPTAFEKQLDKVDLSIAGIGIFNNTVTGNVVGDLSADNEGQSITQFGSNTLGALVSIQYPAKPYFGLEFNYSYARYTENFEGSGISNFFVNPTTTNFQVQTKADEYTFGYLIEPPHQIFGLQPFLSAGAGPQGFRPTAFGGEELPEKARMTYYYSLGVQKDYSQHIGFRVGFRELFFLDPDFGQNYLTILKHANTLEPMVGFYLRY